MRLNLIEAKTRDSDKKSAPASIPERDCQDRTSVIAANQLPAQIDHWDEYFLLIAKVVALKSKDPRCKVGAVIARQDIVLSTGFNGFVRGVYDDQILLANAEEKLKNTCHAETNAIYNAAKLGVSIEGASIFVTKFPCLACCHAIIQTGIEEITTYDHKFWDDDPADSDHSRKIATLRQARLKVNAPFHPQFAPRPTQVPLNR